MQIDESRKGMLPWAVAKKPGYKGDASGLYFRFFRTEQEAEKTRRWLKKHGHYQEPVTYMPGHCYNLGAIRF